MKHSKDPVEHFVVAIVEDNYLCLLVGYLFDNMSVRVVVVVVVEVVHNTSVRAVVVVEVVHNMFVTVVVVVVVVEGVVHNNFVELVLDNAHLYRLK